MAIYIGVQCDKCGKLMYEREYERKSPKELKALMKIKGWKLKSNGDMICPECQKGKMNG